MNYNSGNVVFTEPLEGRWLMAWSAYAQLIGQDTAANSFTLNNGSGQTVALIDTGIDYTNSSLGGGFGAGFKVIGGYDFADNDADPMDTDGHGTETAGMVAANPYTFNGVTYAGIAPAAKLVALRVSSGETGISDTNIEKALQWVVTNHETYGISVVNLSLGAGSYTSDQTNSTYGDEFQTLRDLNITVVAASGNSGTSPISSRGISYPAADKNVLAVGAVDPSDTISDFTQRDDMLDLLAPGENVVSTTLNNTYATVDGTSFSSPIVAGLAAIVKQINADFSVTDIASILRTSSATNYDGDFESGFTSDREYARVNVTNAIVQANAFSSTQISALPVEPDTFVDTAYDPYGTLSVAYYDPATSDIKFSYRLSNGNYTQAVAIDTSADVLSLQFSLAIDQSGKPAVAFHDKTTGDLKLARFNGATWTVSPVDTEGNVGKFASLTFDATGDAMISYFDVTSGDLEFAQYNRSGRTWSISVLDSDGRVGRYSSIATTVSGGAEVTAVAYADDTHGDLKYIRRSTSTSTWTEFLVDDLTGVANIELSLENGRAAIAYQDTTATDVKYAYRNNDWFTETVAETRGVAGTEISIGYDASDNLQIVFYNQTQDVTLVATRQGANDWTKARLTTGGSVAAVSASPDGVLAWVGFNVNQLIFELITSV